MDIGFAINTHDKDGDIIDECIMIYFNDFVLIRIEGMEELEQVIKKLQNIKTEIIENNLTT